MYLNPRRSVNYTHILNLQKGAYTVYREIINGQDVDVLHFISVFLQVTPLTALKFAELSVKAGIPKGVINILPGSGNEDKHQNIFSEPHGLDITKIY